MSNDTDSPTPTPSVVELLCLLHDGDDRCGCLRLALNYAVDAAAFGYGDPSSTIADTLTYCLATHPVGAKARRNGFPSARNEAE